MISPSEEDAKFACDQLARGCNTMEQLLNGLLDSKGRVAEEVHAIRKLGKSLRGGFSLFLLEKNSSKEVQTIGRLLSSPRDAISRFSTWTKLNWQGGGSTFAAIHGMLEQQTHSAARRPPPETVSWCIERVTAARNHLLALSPETLPERMEIGIQKLGKRVIKRCRRLHKHGEEDFHDARKALKAYLGAIAFLPQGTIVPAAEMTELAEILGDENDLTTLSIWLESHGFSEDFASGIWEKLGDSRAKLRQQAIADATVLAKTEGKAEGKKRK